MSFPETFKTFLMREKQSTLPEGSVSPVPPRTRSNHNDCAVVCRRLRGKAHLGNVKHSQRVQAILEGIYRLLCAFRVWDEPLHKIGLPEPISTDLETFPSRGRISTEEAVPGLNRHAETVRGRANTAEGIPNAPPELLVRCTAYGPVKVKMAQTIQDLSNRALSFLVDVEERHLQQGALRLHDRGLQVASCLLLSTAHTRLWRAKKARLNQTQPTSRVKAKVSAQTYIGAKVPQTGLTLRALQDASALHQTVVLLESM